MTTRHTKAPASAPKLTRCAAAVALGRIPGFRLWNIQADWKVPGTKGSSIAVGVNNLADKRYYTRNVDGNPGRMVGAPRMLYVQGRLAF